MTHDTIAAIREAAEQCYIAGVTMKALRFHDLSERITLNANKILMLLDEEEKGERA